MEALKGKVVELINRRVCFKVFDIYIPDLQKILLELHGHDILQGEVMDISYNAAEEKNFAAVKLEGVEQLVVLPVERILSVL